MKPTCPACGQDLPGKSGRICGLCGNRILMGERWHTVGSLVQHRDCDDVKLDKLTNPPHPRLMEELA